MNQDVYETLTQARAKLFDMQVSYLMETMDGLFRENIDVVAMAVDDCLDELDRLGRRIKELEKPRFKGRENYLEYHESRDELQIKPSGF